jgi:hypothetical protein
MLQKNNSVWKETGSKSAVIQSWGEKKSEKYETIPVTVRGGP